MMALALARRRGSFRLLSELPGSQGGRFYGRGRSGQAVAALLGEGRWPVQTVGWQRRGMASAATAEET